MRFKRHKAIAALAVLAIAAGLFLLLQMHRAQMPREKVALITSLPIYWADGADIASLASGHGEIPWAREILQGRYELLPLDSLADRSGKDEKPFGRLIIAQPRALSPQDNVFIDEWVKRGGHLLLVIDPLLTGQYSVPLGDPGHPMTVGLIPPILGQWGIGMRFDENQPFALQRTSVEGIDLPFAMAGEVYLLEGSQQGCTVSASGIIAHCDIGRGAVTILADATLFELEEPSNADRKALLSLVDLAFE